MEEQMARLIEAGERLGVVPDPEKRRLFYRGTMVFCPQDVFDKLLPIVVVDAAINALDAAEQKAERLERASAKLIDSLPKCEVPGENNGDCGELAQWLDSDGDSEWYACSTCANGTGILRGFSARTKVALSELRAALAAEREGRDDEPAD